jgi:hypothetical protein
MAQASLNKAKEGLEVIESQIRELYGRVVYSHKAHEKCADQRLTELNRLKIAQIILSALTTGGLVATIFGDPSVSKASAIISVILSTVLFVITTYTKDTDYGKLAQQHKETARRLWAVRESYLSLLTDLQSGVISIEAVRSKRDELQAELTDIYGEAPRTTKAGYEDARKGLRYSEELTFSDEEIDVFLPEPLRKKSPSTK